MAKVMKICAWISTMATIGSILVFIHLNTNLWFSLSITFGTIAYHFVMRLCVGYTVHCIFHNQMDHTKKWFQPLQFEEKVYSFLKVKQWKKHMPTYSPASFVVSDHSYTDIAGAMCQAEIVHEIIIPLSFLPTCFIPLFGEPFVFVLTSLLSAIFDLAFVIIQRYNRPRILRLAQKHKRK